MKLSDDLDARLRHEAQRRGITISELTREAIETYLGTSSNGRRKLIASAAGRSGLHDVSVRIEEILRDGGLPIALIVDAGPLYAYVDADDNRHPECLELLESHPGPLFVPVLVVTEVVYLLGTRLPRDAEVRFLGDFAAGSLIAERVAPDDWLRMAELVLRYKDLPLGTVVASVVVAAERLAIRSVATLDRRHFTVVRPRHTTAFGSCPKVEVEFSWYMLGGPRKRPSFRVRSGLPPGRQ